MKIHALATRLRFRPQLHALAASTSVFEDSYTLTNFQLPAPFAKTVPHYHIQFRRQLHTSATEFARRHIRLSARRARSPQKVHFTARLSTQRARSPRASTSSQTRRRVTTQRRGFIQRSRNSQRPARAISAEGSCCAAGIRVRRAFEPAQPELACSSSAAGIHVSPHV